MRIIQQLRPITLVLSVFMFVFVSIVSAQIPSQAPPAPEPDNEMPPGRGFIPPPMDLSHLTGQLPPAKMAKIMAPAQFDWRTTGKVTSVKNQGGCGSCYSFAALANFESKLLIDGQSSYDLSENNAKECNFHDRSCGGGNFYDMASLFSLKGTALESCDPYVAADVSCNTGCTNQQTLLDWRIISGGAIPSTDALKNYIQTYGPIYTSFYTGDGNDPSWMSEFNNYDGSYTMYHTSAQPVNHAVQIVGWDDTLSHAGGAGAWIVKNSWGTSWGGTCGYGSEGGYFTLAYGSANMGMWSSFVQNWQDYDIGGVILNHDEGGWMTQYGYNGYTYAWGMCKFTPAENISVTSIEFWTTDATTDIDVYLYDDFDGTTLSNLLSSKLDTSFDEAGYHSVPLPASVSISSGNDIYAAVKFSNATYGSPVAVDTGYVDSMTTYMSLTAPSGSWYDLGARQGDDVAIRVRGTVSLAQSVDDEEPLSPFSWQLARNYPNPFNPVTTIEYSLAERTYVDISIFNILGQKINNLVNETKPAGSHQAKWDGNDRDGKTVASGIYFYRIEAGQFSETKKMILLK